MNESIRSDITFRLAEPKDLGGMQNLFVETIKSVCEKDYSPSQIQAWTSSIKNTKRWEDLIKEQYVLLLEKNNLLLGFASLKNNTYLDFFYLHKDYQGQGLAKMLYLKIESIAKSNGASQLTSDISITAKPFFESRGFVSLKKQHNEVRGEALINYKMKKELAP